jgi:hypothetical protein
MQAVYKNECLPLRTRLYAANRATEHEPLLRRDQLIDVFFEDPSIVAEIEANAATRAKESDAKLRELIVAGKVDETAALLVRGIFVGEDAPVWEPIPVTPGPEAEIPIIEPRQIEYVPRDDADATRSCGVTALNDAPNDADPPFLSDG